ncbi:MAG: aconitase [Ilumatobacteraceae bacterium]|nr:aconitase [Ilumatobacteraceae bacterium]
MTGQPGQAGPAGGSFGARRPLTGGDGLDRYDLSAAGDGVHELPYSLKVLLENLLRHEDGTVVTADDIAAVAAWPGDGARREVAFHPARVLLQDFTGVPAIADLAALRDAVEELGGDPAAVRPVIPADLVIDHSVSVDAFGSVEALDINTDLDFHRNAERYRFLRWGQQAFEGLRVVPPGRGICHQVNLEHLATVVTADRAGGVIHPDTVVGTDSHTPMVNGLGVMGWGVGGIEAEAALLGQPSSLLLPDVIGLRLDGELPPGTTATDLVLTITELLRHHGVVGTFVELYGPGVSNVPVENRATIGNMSPEYGSTVTIFPIDGETLRYLRLTGRSESHVDLVERYAKEQGLWFEPQAVPRFTSTVELDLGSVEPSIAGPTRPQDRIPLRRARQGLATALETFAPAVGAGGQDEASALSFPASDPPSGDPPHPDAPDPVEAPAEVPVAAPVAAHGAAPVRVALADGTEVDLDHGAVVIAAITSCTNTSNPSVMLGAGLLAERAVERGLQRQPWVKTSLAPGSRAVTDYLVRAGLMPTLEALGFHLVGYGCTTCIGNSGPLLPEVAAAVRSHGLSVAAVLSGNRNFEGRINPDVRLSYLASPMLVVAYALAGTVDIDLAEDALGTDAWGEPVRLADLWPTDEDIDAARRRAVDPSVFARAYDDIDQGDERWRQLPTPSGSRFPWDPDGSTYVHRPPFLDGLAADPSDLRDVTGARVLALLGDSVTTDHISPAGAIDPTGPAGAWLRGRGVEEDDFNSYGSRRGNHEVMVRGTFANRRLRNLLVPGTEGGVTRHWPTGETTTIHAAAVAYAASDTPLVVLAGKDYGSGSSRDWAAKGTALLGVRAVIAESFERIHRANLIGMGVLPLQFGDGVRLGDLGLAGDETVDITGVAALATGGGLDEVALRIGGAEVAVTVRLDTPLELRQFAAGGILPLVARAMARRGSGPTPT